MNFSNMSPSHGLQLFTNCSSVGPSHGVQSFRNRLLQRESPTGSQGLPAHLLQHGLLSPQGHRYLLHRGPPWTEEGQPASPRSSSQAARQNSLLQHLEHLLPLLHHRPWCLQSCFSHFISLLSLTAVSLQLFAPLPS